MDYYEVPTTQYDDESYAHNEQREIDYVENEIKPRFDKRSDASAGKLFVGGVSWETTEDVFTNYFSKYGEIVDSVIMKDKYTGRPRGFGFVTFADPAVAEDVLLEDHVIDGRMVEIKRTVPREEMEGRGVSRTKKIFVGGLPLSLTEDELKEYFSSYGSIVEHQIMLDRNTGRSRGFGFVTFENEEAVERIFSEGRNHEIGGKQVEIKNAEPKRAVGDHNGGSSRSHGSYGNNFNGYGGGYSSRGRVGGKMGRGYGGSVPSDGFSAYGGSYRGAPAGFYGGYGGFGYGFGFGGPMYYSGGYAGNGYGFGGGYAGMAGYGGGKAYGNRAVGAGSGGYGSGKSFENVGGGYGSGGYGSGKSFDNGTSSYGGGRSFENDRGGYGSGKAFENGTSSYGGGKGLENGGAAASERYHPYQR